MFKSLLIIICLAMVLFVVARRTQAQTNAQELGSLYDLTVKTIDGSDKSLSDYKGKVLLIVNTASKCGFTGQYQGLEALYEQYKDQGFEILAFPANDFLGQEPGSNEEIKSFCALKYKTTFPLFAKITVKGDAMSPVYRYLTTASGFEGGITWNFNKFLIGRDGKVIARFDSKIEPQDPSIIQKLQEALK